MSQMAQEAEEIRQRQAQPEIGGFIISEDPICEMFIVLTPQLLKFARIPGLVDKVIRNESDARKNDLGFKDNFSTNQNLKRLKLNTTST